MSLNYKKYALAVAFIIVTIAIIVIGYLLTNKSIKLKQYEWKVISENQTVILDSAGNVTVGPGNIMLWAEYPFIIGTVGVNNSHAVLYFVIDISKNKTTIMTSFDYYTFRHRNGIKIPPDKLVTFYDLKGQYGSKQKNEELVKALTK